MKAQEGEEVKNISKPQDNRNLTFRRKLTLPLVKFLAKTNITPNQISLFNTLLLFLVGIMLASGDYLYMVLAVIIFQIMGFIDVLDGGLARLTNQTSKLGAWLDSRTAIWSDFVLITSLAIGTSNILLGLLTLFVLSIFKISGAEFHRTITVQPSYNQGIKKLGIFSRLHGHDFQHTFLYVLLLLNQSIIYLYFILFLYMISIPYQQYLQMKSLRPKPCPACLDSCMSSYGDVSCHICGKNVK